MPPLSFGSPTDLSLVLEKLPDSGLKSREPSLLSLGLLTGRDMVLGWTHRGGPSLRVKSGRQGAGGGNA